MSKDTWSKDEVYLLPIAISIYGMNFKAVAEFMGTRNYLQCRQKYFQLQQENKGHWTPEEDAVLMRVKMNNGPIEEIIEATGKTPERINARWDLYLNPAINKTKMTSPEIDYIFYLYKHFGNQWKKIALQTNGRTQEMVRKLIVKSDVYKLARMGRPVDTTPDVLSQQEFMQVNTPLNIKPIQWNGPNELQIVDPQFWNEIIEIFMNEATDFGGNQGVEQALLVEDTPRSNFSSWSPSSSDTYNAYCLNVTREAESIEDMEQPYMLESPQSCYHHQATNERETSDNDQIGLTNDLVDDQVAEDYMVSIVGSKLNVPCDV
ncbi:hypothetical protein THRCLA_00573 [Thraustotheca clavata]|uniref:Uncharacterized protein n=1 Tax=Thraustotheca clavata TaxID=74557 RepID=A0A1W0AB75_9STRA|nr:hypothetical protein THRCLA_00573 [Thraustotheca clavata]